jgi:hypothetical protein
MGVLGSVAELYPLEPTNAAILRFTSLSAFELRGGRMLPNCRPKQASVLENSQTIFDWHRRDERCRIVFAKSKQTPQRYDGCSGMFAVVAPDNPLV